MNERIKLQISEYGDIQGAISRLEESTAGCPDVCILICEELLDHLLKSGYRKIGMTVKGRKMRVIEIRAEGEEDALHTASAADDPDRIASEIKNNLLLQHSGYYDFQYRRGVNRYRIYTAAPANEELDQQLNDFYENATERERRHPLSPILHLIRMHPGRFALSMAIKAGKHVGALLLPVFAANIIDSVIATGVFFSRPVFLNLAGTIISILANLVLCQLDNRLYRAWTRNVKTAFIMAIIRKIQVLSLRFQQQMPAGKLLSKLIADAENIRMLIYMRLSGIIDLGVDILFVIIAALSRFPLMLLFYVLTVPAAVFFIRRVSKPVLKRKAEVRKHTEAANASFKEILDMNALTRAQGMQKTEYRTIASKMRLVDEANERFETLTVRINSITFGVSQGFRVICLCFAAYLASIGAISIGTVILFQSLFEMMIGSVQKVLDQIPDLIQGYDSLISINEVLFEKDVEHNGTRELPKPARGEIELQEVVFGYSEQNDPLLNHISLRIPSGGSAAFVGKSGAGKSTLLNLILGLYTPKEGKILIDGIDLNELNKNSYRRQVAVVPQQTVLFSGTLWDNLVYGLNYVRTDRVMNVLKSVGLDELVDRLPEGLNTPVLEGGSNLSGGQRQRIAIARALLRNAKIILFDEPTSALDPESERQVQSALDEAMKHATVVMVAHRLNTLQKVDRIYRLEDGRVIAYESCDEMMKAMLPEEAGRAAEKNGNQSSRQEITVPASLDSVAAVTYVVNAKLNTLNCSEEIRVQIDVCLDEILGNIARYAYAPGEGSVTVGMNVTDNPLAMELVFTDQGVPFNPLGTDWQDIGDPTGKRSVRGLGISMVQKMTDDMTYEYRNGSNVLTIRKKLHFISLRI